MRIEFYNGDTAGLRRQGRHRMTVQVPGFVSTSSWACPAAMEQLPAPVQKGRLTAPPPSCFIGLHRLTLEAFWQD